MQEHHENQSTAQTRILYKRHILHFLDSTLFAITIRVLVLHKTPVKEKYDFYSGSMWSITHNCNTVLYQCLKFF